MSHVQKRFIPALVILGFITITTFYAYPTLHTRMLMIPAGLAYFFAFWLSLIYALTELRAQGVRAFGVFAACNAIFFGAVFIGCAIHYVVYGTFLPYPH